MGRKIVRFESDAPLGHQWGVIEGTRVNVIEDAFDTTRALIVEGLPRLRAGTLAFGASRALDALALLSPITHPCKVIAQATNYGDHVREVGMDPSARTSNVLFRKASAAITGPNDAIIRPSHVRLLDYEIELGLVIGAATRGPRTVGPHALAELVVGFVIGNDVSARDVQVPEGQFYKGKSYPTFCPLGPYLYIAEPDELARWPEFELSLLVNGEVRQRALAAAMIHAPAETLTEVTGIEDLEPGDVILTGTPGGVALSPPKKPLRAIGELLPEAMKWRMFIEGQQKSPRYLKPGDRITASIRTPDGRIDLGTQNNLIR